MWVLVCIGESAPEQLLYIAQQTAIRNVNYIGILLLNLSKKTFETADDDWRQKLFYPNISILVDSKSG